MRIRPKITLRGFKPNAHGAGHVLGELETAVMELLWREPELTVNQVEERLQQRRQIAHTTVLTTLDRMHRKGYLTREKSGKAFVYAPRYSREEFERGLAQEVLGALLGGDAADFKASLTVDWPGGSASCRASGPNSI